MSAGDCLFISGATGINAGLINGGYDRTDEMCGGYALYRKRCDPGTIMEHCGDLSSWQIKHQTCVEQRHDWLLRPRCRRMRS
jgi:hypothetical protein